MPKMESVNKNSTGSCTQNNIKPLKFKLNRHSFPKMKSDSVLNSSIVSEIDNSSVLIGDSANPKKRKYQDQDSSNPYFLSQSICCSELTKRRIKLESNSNSPTEQPIEYKAVSLISSDVGNVFSTDSEELNSSVVNAEISQNDSTMISEYSVNNSTTLSESMTPELDSIKNENSQFSEGSFSLVHSSLENANDEEVEDASDHGSMNKDVVPIFAGYQLIGDSQLLRFSQKILGLERDFSVTSSGSLGLCVSGQKISDLHRRILEKFHPVGDQAILLIGTNDLLKDTTSYRMCRGLKFLVQDILMSAKKVVILTLPPVPKLAYKADHWARLNVYNDYIKSLPDKFQGKVSVADISPLFCKSSTRVCRLSCFEQWFYGGRRQDLIHINEKGFKIIRQFLLKYAL